MTVASNLEDDNWPIGVPRPPRGEDLPWDDGEPMESTLHRLQMDYLCELFDVAVKADGGYVCGNMALYYSALQAKRNDFKAPDVFVILDPVGDHPRKSWVVWEEDGRVPNVVVELLSESTEAKDRGLKMRIYERLLRVPNYYLYDPIDFRLEGYRLVGGVYVPLIPDAHGRLYWGERNLWLGRWHGTRYGQTSTWLRLFDADGELVPTPTEAEAQRAEAEAQRAEAEAQRAEAEAQRAEAEAQRANAAEARVEALLLELERLRSTAVGGSRSE